MKRNLVTHRLYILSLLLSFCLLQFAPSMLVAVEPLLPGVVTDTNTNQDPQPEKNLSTGDLITPSGDGSNPQSAQEASRAKLPNPFKAIGKLFKKPGNSEQEQESAASNDSQGFGNLLNSFGKILSIPGSVVKEAFGGAGSDSASGNNGSGGRNITYAGYSQDFLGIKALLANGEAEQALQQHLATLEKKSKPDSWDRKRNPLLGNDDAWNRNKNQKEVDVSDKSAPEYRDASLLFALEQGLIALDADHRADATDYFELSEQLLEQRQDEGAAETTLKKLGAGAGKLLGFGESGSYRGEAYERILMLNYKSIAYMLNGDRRAYNVTRRSINWQNREKREFDQEMQRVNERLEQEQRALQEKADKKAGEEKTEAVVEAQKTETRVTEKTTIEETSPKYGSSNLLLTIQEQYKASESKALQVPNAFVNPFGFYMAGIVQEYDSYDDKSLRDNARISYKKALELKPGSTVIEQALEEIKQAAPKGKRLVHIILAEGFAPEKKVLRFDHAIYGTSVAIKLPIYEQDDSLMASAEIQDADGKVLSTLDQIADIDAIAMRHQYDSLSKQHLNLVVSVTRAVFENRALDNLGWGGQLFKMGRESLSNPDMRSWMTLPKQILAARLFLPKEQTDLRLVIFDKQGNVLSRKSLVLNSENHNFIYARSIDRTLYTSNSEQLWVVLR